MIISIEELKEKQRKKIIGKVLYLRKKFRSVKKYFITITFRTFEDYIKFDREDRKKLMNNLRKNYNLYGAFSVVEAQRRGVPHVHLLVWMPKKLYLDKKFSHLYSIGMTNIKRIRNKQVINYLLKYCLKDNERDIIKYKYKQHFYSFYYKNKRKNKEWVLMSLTGINRILRKYEIKKRRIKDYNYINVGGHVIKYKIFTSFKQDGLHIKDVYLYDFWEDKEYWLLDFRDYKEFLEWFECLILVKLNLN
jgi:hypothetical protein